MAWQTGRGVARTDVNCATAGARVVPLTGFGHTSRRLRLETRLASRPCLPGAMDAVFEDRQLLGADRPAGVEFAGGNADLGAEAEFSAVGELGRGVMQHDRRIDLVEKLARDSLVLGHDRIGVVRAMVVNMCDRGVDAIDHLGCDDRVLIFGVPVLLGGRLHPGIGGLHDLVAADFAAGVDQPPAPRLAAAPPAGAAPSLKPLVEMLIDAGCEVRGDEVVQAADPRLKPASEQDWNTEYEDAIIAAKVVDGVDAAIAHIHDHGSHHTDAIVTQDEAIAR